MPNHLTTDELAEDPGMPSYLTTDELAELLRTTSETVRYWRHVGKGPRSFKVGRRVLYARSDVAGFIDAARREPLAAADDLIRA